TDEHKNTFQSAFANNIMQNTKCYFENDIIAAWASGTLCKPGIAIISGTGSNAIGINSDGKAWQTGGYGHILDDEGSGYLIGLNGFRKALQYYDGRSENTCLIEEVFSYLEISRMEQILTLFYQKTISKDRIAAFAEYVAHAARRGDHVAKKIFFEAGMEIARLAAAIIRKLEFSSEFFPIALRGSVFKSYDLLEHSIETVLKIAPRAKIISDEKNMLSPVKGAILLASRAAGIWDHFDIR
ncbi:MAG: BadF/BadG/BcrA/BcrD ATPase family protein, partial [Chitinispirillia bacterium]